MAEWDVFISHASEDKASVVRPLAKSLSKLGLRVWFDEYELKVGDSLAGSIDRGLINSRHGIVVLSKAFFSKDWPEYEFRGLVAKSLGVKRSILPLWHKIGRDEVMMYSPPLADVLSLSTEESLDVIALKLAEVINPKLHKAILRRIAYKNTQLKMTVKSIPISKIEIGKVRHTELPKSIVNRIILIRAVMFDVMPHTLDEWVDGFQRDTHPTDELEIWESMASSYTASVNAIDANIEEKYIIFQGLLLASTTDYENAIQSFLKIESERLKVVMKAIGLKEELFKNKHNTKKINDSIIDNLYVEDFTGEAATIDSHFINLLAEKIKK